jgi:hypothetical protein
MATKIKQSGADPSTRKKPRKKRRMSNRMSRYLGKARRSR